MIQYAGLWFPEDGTLTRALKARIDAGVYRGDRLAEAIAHCRRKRFAVDCGANVGLWTRELAKHFGVVVAIEPNPLNVECLEANTADLKNLTVIQAAVGAEAGSVDLEEQKGAFSSKVVPWRPDMRRRFPVPMMRLDDLMLEGVEYIKVHVNGYELQALKGAAETLRRCRPVLTVVLKPALERFDTTPEDVIGWLAEHQYLPAGGQKPYRIFKPS